MLFSSPKFLICFRYTADDVVGMVENGEFVEVDVFITPPGGDLTDEDSSDEDGGGMLDNLSSRQLQAEAEVHLKTRQESGDDSVLSVSHSISSRARGKKHDVVPLNMVYILQHVVIQVLNRTSLEVHMKV